MMERYPHFVFLLSFFSVFCFFFKKKKLCCFGLATLSPRPRFVSSSFSGHIGEWWLGGGVCVGRGMVQSARL